MKDVLLYTPDVRFPGDFARRLAAARARVRASRERTEGRGPAGLFGAGEEFVGFRPYRTGEDLRHLDWSLLARSDRPYVRVMRRESAEHWRVWLDASGSMGVGAPSKLQLGAELALALAAVGIDAGAEVRVDVTSDDRAARGLSVRAKPALARLRAFLEATRASGRAASFAGARASRAPQRVFVVGDLAGVRPSDLLAAAPARAEITVAHLLAPHELAPPAGDVRWWDPESAAELTVRADDVAIASYGRALGAELESWRAACARRGAAHAVITAGTPFERALARAIGS